MPCHAWLRVLWPHCDFRSHTTLQGLCPSVPRACAAADAVLPRTGAGCSPGPPAWCVCRLPQRCLTCTSARGGDERGRLRCCVAVAVASSGFFPFSSCIGGATQGPASVGPQQPLRRCQPSHCISPARHMYDLDVPRQFFRSHRSPFRKEKGVSNRLLRHWHGNVAVACCNAMREARFGCDCGRERTPGNK
jgi:hypothetical protein